MFRGATGSVALTFALMLLVPTGLAAEAEGTFTLTNPARFPPGSEATFALLTLLFNDTSNARGLLLQAPFVSVELYEMRALALPGGIALQPPASPTKASSWNLTSATVELRQGDHAGYLGVHADGDAQASVAFATAPTMETRPYSTIATRTESTGNARKLPFFFERIDRPHLYSSTPGWLTLTGSASVKIQGPDVRIRAHNVTDIETGMTQPSQAEIVYRWLHLTFPQGSLTVDVPDAPLELAAATAPLLTWDGPATLTPLDGALRTHDATYAAGKKGVRLDGAFTASLAPLPGGQTARMDLSGELRATSLVRQSAPAPVGEAGAFPLLIVVGVAVLAGGGGLALGALYRRRKATPAAVMAASAVAPEAGWDGEYCKDAADFAASREDWSRALLWTQRARKLAPTSARLAADEAVFLAETGDMAGAKRAFREAHELSTDGEFAMEAAYAMQLFGQPIEDVEAWATLAVERSPELVRHTDADFPSLHGRVSWVDTAGEAWRKLRSRGKGEGRPGP